MFRFLGTYVIHSNSSNENKESGQSSSDDNVSASSTLSSHIRLFFGSSPIKYTALYDISSFKEERAKANNRNEYLSVLFEQNCSYFCPVQKCFQSQWIGRHIRSEFNLNCQFDEDGAVSALQLSNYFVLQWNRQQPPSTAHGKWTKDVVDVGNNMPGTLTLSVPSVFMNANRNVTSIISMLDTHIESLMDIRSKIYPAN